MSFWKNKVVFLTGASSGIGEALAIDLSKQGAILGLLARREELLRDLTDKCKANRCASEIFRLRYNRRNCGEKRGGKITREFGKIDVLIANAGIGGAREISGKLNFSGFSARD
jgi:dehydrogenase/reductase SDR family protein 7B